MWEQHSCGRNCFDLCFDNDCREQGVLIVSAVSQQRINPLCWLFSECGPLRFSLWTSWHHLQLKKISLNSVWDHKTESIIRSTMEESAFNYQIIGSSKWSADNTKTVMSGRVGAKWAQGREQNTNFYWGWTQTEAKTKETQDQQWTWTQLRGNKV